MALAPTQVGSIAHIALGALLMTCGALVAARLRMPGKAWLACFLALVGIDYAVDGLRHIDPQFQRAKDFAAITGVLDPLALLLFALAQERSVPRWALAALAAGPVLLAAEIFAAARAGGRSLDFGPLILIVLLPYYTLVLGLAARAHHGSRASGERTLRATIFTLLAIILFPRLFLAVDVWTLPIRHERVSFFALDLPFILGSLIAALVFVRTAPPHSRDSARQIVRRLAVAYAFIALIWSMRLVPIVNVGSGFYLYSVRWYVFFCMLALNAPRFEAYGISARATRGLRMATASLVLLVIYLALLGIYLWFEPDKPPLEIPLYAGIVTLAFALLAFVLLGGRDAVASPALRRARVYRAHLELGKPLQELERVREELGLTPVEAAREAKLVELERAAPAKGFDQPQKGQIFAGRYDVGEIVGSGAYGLVYEAFDNVDQQRVVLKELREDWRASGYAVELFRREAEAMLRIRDEHVVRLLDIERSSHGHVLVLEYVDGKPLAAILAEGTLDSEKAMRLALCLLDAIQALHDARVLHRDIKPANIMLRPNGDAVLIDLGSALYEEESATKPSRIAHTGTPRYMSPEQRKGARLTPSSDLYALGAVLWESLTGRPYPEGEPPAEWRATLKRALAEDPQERFQDAAAFRAALPAVGPPDRY